MLSQEILEAIKFALTEKIDLDDTWGNNDVDNKAFGLISSLLSGDTIASLWHIDDVRGLSIDDNGDYDGSITDEQARRVLALAELEMDAEVGINWDSLRAHLEEVRRES